MSPSIPDADGLDPSDLAIQQDLDRVHATAKRLGRLDFFAAALGAKREEVEDEILRELWKIRVIPRDGDEAEP